VTHGAPQELQPGSGLASIANDADREALEEMIENQLLIEDPAAHEALMIDRILNPNRGVNGESRSF
jgi:hypothetical protein